MCGIYGQNKWIDPAMQMQLSDSMRHRGPDDQQCLNIDEIGLFHTRLAIIDINGGKQPMQRGHLSIVFNGEIYNHIELREKYNLDCLTRSDTETLLALFEKCGEDFLPDLDGMFAFCIYDERNQKLFLARDRMGEKPLYYFHKGKYFAFASELDTLAGNLELEIEENGLKEFLVKGWIGPNNTVYKHVFILPPGSFGYFDINNPGNALMPFRWWKHEEALTSASKLGFEEAKERIISALRAAVKSRMESSDLAVGSFLSGGIDSGLVTAFASEFSSNLHTFTFKFEGAFDESPIAEQVSKKFNTNHHILEIDYAHLREDIGKILIAYGEPYCDDSAIPSWYVSREAKQHLTVVLNGDGGDEIFGGYRRYVPYVWPLPMKAGLETIGLLREILPVPRSKMSYYNYLYRLARLQQSSPYKKYLAGTTDLFWDNILGKSIYDDSFMKWIDPILELKSLTPLRKTLLSDYMGLLPIVLLKKVDIATMQHSLESRSVFFAPELMNISSSLPDSFLVQSRQTKRILRSIAEDVLPGNIHNLPKRGFEPPLTKWMDGQLNGMMKEYVLAYDAYGKHLFGEANLEKLVNKKLNLANDRWGKLIFSLFGLEYWLKHRTTKTNRGK